MTPAKSIRFPDALAALIQAEAERSRRTFSEVCIDVLGEAMDAKAPPAKGAPRTAKAKEALQVAEAREGVRSVMDSLPMGNIRPPMQRARDMAKR